MGRAPRERQILECLKLGQRELDWLYEVRADAVHHDEIARPLKVARTTDATVLIGGPETCNFGAVSAQRAAGLVRDAIWKCLDHPKPATEAWTAGWRTS